jgi:hypothetical protein
MVEAIRIGECEAGSHLFYPGDDITEVDGVTVCSSCYDLLEKISA